MQRAVKYLIEYYELQGGVEELYNFFKEEISGKCNNNYFPNPLQSASCVHIVNSDFPDHQPVVVEGTLDYITEGALYSTCYPIKPMEGTDW
jgi:hypothetical protein